MYLTREITYQAARTVAGQLKEHFSKLLTAAQERGDTELATEPHTQAIEAILDTAFWASLRHEEGRSPKISLAFLPPGQAEQPLLFAQRLPLLSTVLTKLAPGVERQGIHLGVWFEEDDFYVWGTTRNIPSLCLVVDVSEPGLLVVKHRRNDGYGKYANVAILKGDQVKLVDEEHSTLPDCPSMLTSLLGFTSPATWHSSVNVLIQLAVSMRAHRHGGTLLVVPSQTSQWKESIVHPISYTVSPAFNAMANLLKQEDERENNLTAWQAALKQEVESIAGLTAIDGATIISDSYELLAFGAKIGRPKGSNPVEEIFVTEPILGGEASMIHPSQNGGTRHLSAAQFVHDQRDAVALVASQDGRFTIFSWSPCEQMVQAHRIDALLL